MTFAQGWILHFFWIVPLVGLAIIVESRRRRRALDRFADVSLMERLVPADRRGIRVIKAVLLTATVTVMIVAMAGPRWGSRYEEVSRRGVDIMMAVDVSRSMMVEDVKPTRLERARREIADFLRVVEGDRVGLTTFAGTAFIQCPLTLDYAALEMFLSALEPGIIPVAGTDLGAAIETSITAFDSETSTDKVMLLITDGEDNEERGLAAAGKAAEKGVKIFVFGIGNPSGGPVPAAGEGGGFTKDNGGKMVMSKLDEKTLRDIAAVTDGVYVRSAAGDLDLDILYFDGIKKRTEAEELKSGKVRVAEERFHILVIIAFLLLFVEGLLDEKKRLVKRKRFGFLMIAVVIIVTAFRPAPAAAADTPDDLYREGRYEAAAAAYAAGDMDHPKDIRYRYNRGCAAFQEGRFDEAAAAFSSVMRRVEENENNVRFRASYNLGNTAFKQQNYTAAVDYYTQALAEDPDNEDARFNLELALKAREEMKDQSQKKKSDGDKTGDKSSDQSKSDGRGEENKEESDRDDEKDANNGDESHDKQNREESQKGDENGDRDGNKDDEDISGDLKGRDELPEQTEKTDTSEKRQPVDRKRAAALLDNVQEDPAQMMRYMVPDRDRRSASGRDW